MGAGRGGERGSEVGWLTGLPAGQAGSQGQSVLVSEAATRRFDSFPPPPPLPHRRSCSSQAWQNQPKGQT